MRDLSRRAPGPRRLSTHVSISIRACIIVRRVYALPPRNFMEILEYISALRALPCFPAQSPTALLHAQEIFMTIDFCMETDCTEMQFVIYYFFLLQYLRHDKFYVQIANITHDTSISQLTCICICLLFTSLMNVLEILEMH